jgi:endonuclease YncB( thermonuclease family)
MGCSISRCKKIVPSTIEVSYKETKPFIVPITSGYVIKVYDGDTITICNRLPIKNCNDIFRFSVRLDGIDTPEMKSVSSREKKLAIEARDALYNKIYNKHITLRNNKTEKYGRILSTIYLGNENINEWMIDNGYAVRYDGKTKTNVW